MVRRSVAATVAVWVVAMVLGAAGLAGAQALGLWDSPLEDGPLYRKAAPADIVCYRTDPGYVYMGTQPRPDVISTFIKYEPDGRIRVCYLRPPSMFGSWSQP